MECAHGYGKAKFGRHSFSFTQRQTRQAVLSLILFLIVSVPLPAADITAPVRPGGAVGIPFNLDEKKDDYTFHFAPPPGWEWHGPQQVTPSAAFRIEAVQPSNGTAPFTGRIHPPTETPAVFNVCFHGQLASIQPEAAEGWRPNPPIITDWSVNLHRDGVIKVEPEVVYVDVAESADMPVSFEARNGGDGRPVTTAEWSAAQGIVLHGEKGPQTRVASVPAAGEYWVEAKADESRATGRLYALGVDLSGAAATAGVIADDGDSAQLEVGQEMDLLLSIQPSDLPESMYAELWFEGDGRILVFGLDQADPDSMRWPAAAAPSRLRIRARACGTVTAKLVLRTGEHADIEDTFIIHITGVELDTLRITDSSNPENFREDAVEGMETGPEDTLYLVEQASGTAEVDVGLTWEDGANGAYARYIRWAIGSPAGKPFNWDKDRGNFEENPHHRIWRGAPRSLLPFTGDKEPVREFALGAWYDRDRDGRYDSGEPVRMLCMVILKLDLAADLNWDGQFNEDDPDEYTAPGLIVGANDDDDDADGVIDYADGFNADGRAGTPDDDNAKEDEALGAIQLTFGPLRGLAGGQVELEVTAGAEKIRLWSTPDRQPGTIVLDASMADSSGRVRKVWNCAPGSTSQDGASGAPPEKLYVEGLRHSNYLGDVRLTLRYVDPAGREIGSDEVVITVVKLTLGVDGNRDGTIDFDEPADRSYLFWVNNDIDVADRVRDMERGHGLKVVSVRSWMEEDDAQQGTVRNRKLDCEDGRISCLRDLEDFARLQIRVQPASLVLSGPLELFFLTETDADNAACPHINVWDAFDETDFYLQDIVVAQDQLSCRQIAKTSDVDVPADLKETQNFSGLLPFLFEGAAEGTGQLKAVFKIGDQQLCGDRVDLELHDITWFYDRYRMNRNGTAGRWECRVTPGYKHEKAEYGPATDEYLLYVHGWNMDEWEIERWAETVFKRMWWQGYQGGIGVFMWPTLKWKMPLHLEKAVDATNFDDSEFRSWQSAATLAQLMARLNGSGQLRVIAHSHGNIATAEAIRKLSGMPNIHTYIATQAAVSAHLWDNRCESKYGSNLANAWASTTPNVYGHYHSGTQPEQPYFVRNFSNINNFHNFFNPSDYALSSAWELTMAMRPDQWGGYAYGFHDSDPEKDSYDESRDMFFKRRVRGLKNPKNGFSRTLYPAVGTLLDRLPLVSEDEKLHIGIELERYAIFSYIVESRSRALGTQKRILSPGGREVGSLDLSTYDPLFYNEVRYAHSRQFRSNIAGEWSYWLEVMNRCDFASCRTSGNAE